MALGSKQDCPALRKALFGLILCCSYLEVLNDFFKWSPVAVTERRNVIILIFF